jgi:hypothetical protein
MVWAGVLLLGVLLRGQLFRSTVTYVFERYGKLEYLLDENIERFILQHPEVADREFEDLKDVMIVAAKITSDILVFTKQTTPTDPKENVKTRLANDEAFSTFYSAVCNFLLRRIKVDDKFECRHLVGQCYFLKKNVSEMQPHGPFRRLSSGFPKEFHFNAVFERSTGKTIALDPSLYETHYISQVSLFEILQHP